MRTKSDKCEKYFDRFLALDKNEIIPLSVSLHLLLCPKCRTAVRSMSLAEDFLQQGMEGTGRRPADNAATPRATDTPDSASGAKPANSANPASGTNPADNTDSASGAAETGANTAGGASAGFFNAPQDPVVKAALEQIAQAGMIYPRGKITGRVSLAKWTCGGLILIFCLVIFPFTSMGEWAENVLERSFTISFSIFTGLAVAIYASVFIGSNIDFFVKQISRFQRTKKERD